MKINCISCGYNVNLDDDCYESYEGQIKCFACNAILDIKTDQGQIKSVHFVKIVARPEDLFQTINQ